MSKQRELMNIIESTTDWIGLAVGIVAGAVILVLIITALVQIARAVHLNETVRTNWVLAVIFAPIFGAIAWFAIGNRLRLN